MAIDMRLASKGRGEPREGLVQQGRVHVGLGKEHAAELAANGWPADKTTALEQGVASLESTASVKADAAGGARVRPRPSTRRSRTRRRSCGGCATRCRRCCARGRPG